MVSSGIRIAAWDYLRWKHIIPIKNKDGILIAAKVIVYAGDPEQYYSFITSEAYHALKKWMQCRSSCGEKILGDLGYARSMENNKYAIWLKMLICNSFN